MTKPLKIAVLRDRYPTKFNTPKKSRHILKPVWFLPANLISHRYEGITLVAPVKADLGYFHNRIPAVSTIPFVMSFESHLPRYFGDGKTRLFHFMRRRLASPQCRRIIAMSQFAKKIFLHQHKDAPEFALLRDKLEVIYPNIALPEPRLEMRQNPLPLRLFFVGAHFGRKGGAVAVRAAEIARTRKLPLHFHIVSSLKAGRGVWSDPWQADFFTPYFRLLAGDNITFNYRLSNAEAMNAMRDSDFLLLPTFSDTFGFSALEAMSTGTPAIATPQDALPEFVTHGKNGIMLKLDVDAFNEWIHIGRGDKNSSAYAATFRDEIERLAQELIDSVNPYCDAPEKLLPLRANARATAEMMFDTVKTSPYLDNLYERCVAN